MKFNPFQITLASFVIISSAVLAKVLTPHELMARTTASLDFQKVIPVIRTGPALLQQLAPTAARLARAEGLEAHARSIETRLKLETALKTGHSTVNRQP